MNQPDLSRNKIVRDDNLLDLSNAEADELQAMGGARNNMTTDQRLRAALALEIALTDRYHGNSSWFAREVGVTHSLTRRWRVTGVVPAHRVMDVVELMNHSLIRPEVLRPDVFREARAVGPMQHYDGRGTKRSVLATPI